MLTDILTALETSPISQAIGGSRWGYPALETLHLVGLAALVGAAISFDARLLGAASSILVPRAAHLLLPIARGGFVLAAVTGLAMFTTNATGFATNPAFQIKLLLLVIAGINIAVFHLGVYRRAATWSQRPPAGARTAGAISLVTWTATIAAGRLIAYV